MSTNKIDELEALAGNGDVGAIYELGKAYYFGTGVNQDFGKARGYFETAAGQGSNGANFYLGKIYYNGTGVGVDHAKAKDYFEKSAGANNVFSKYYLGKIYYWGDGVVKDEAKATEYKRSVLSNTIYTNQDTGLKDFYSIPNFEDRTKAYVNELQNKITEEYNILFGKEN